MEEICVSCGAKLENTGTMICKDCESKAKMIEVDGYKAFRGSMRIKPINMPSYVVFGDWLYKPEYNCWYVSRPNHWCESFTADICEVLG